ncbi:hypothetical protein C8Q80DRAFT_1117508 [Daedaleopsis nitida]|nr:hypothetical protein C8Q80DRAFT_1117508 [Daedaleopsis nitida]
MFKPGRAPRLALPLPSAAAGQLRTASRKHSPWPEPQGQPESPRLRTWVSPVSRIANFLIVPNFGDHEHVFMPPRRWLAAQKAAFFSLTPEEQQLAGVDTATSDSYGLTTQLGGRHTTRAPWHPILNPALRGLRWHSTVCDD